MAAATVTAGGGTKSSARPSSELTATATGFTVADALTVTLSATRAAGEAVGSYATTATATGAALSNYTVTYVAGSFSITKAAATRSAEHTTELQALRHPVCSAMPQSNITAPDALTIALSTT